MEEARGYTRPEVLAEPDWVWSHRGDPTVRVIDCGTATAFARAHIPGAVSLSVHPWIKEPERGTHVMGPEAFGESMGKLGVSDGVTVVAYDDYNTSYATRLWWALGYYGHTDARVLNGGWRRWVTEGRPVTFKETIPEPGRFLPRSNEDIMCRLDYPRQKFEDPSVQVLNVLLESHYRGMENPFGNKRVGHIPGSVNIPIEEFLTDDDRGVFKLPAELRAIVERAGIFPDREVIVHCQAGIRTTLAFFVLSLLGWDRLRAYDAAMAEWANRDDTPLVVGAT